MQARQMALDTLYDDLSELGCRVDQVEDITRKSVKFALEQDLTDMKNFDINAMRKNREAGSPSPWFTYGDNGICHSQDRFVAVCVAANPTPDADARRIASVPVMEEEIERLTRELEKARRG